MERASRRILPRSRRRLRGQWCRVGTVVSMVALAFALLRLQVVDAQRYALIAKENRMRPIVVRAPRGTVYDRNGRVVAENVVGYRVLLMPAPRDSMLAALERLRPVLGLSDRDVARALRRYEREPHLPMVVHNDVSSAAVARLEERRFRFPGVLTHAYPKRHYPAGRDVAHLVGYVAEISDRELDLPEFRGYRQGRWIGKAGIERYYEKHLGGDPGVRYLEVDALGRIKRWLPEEMGVPPVPGKDLQLYLDLDLQRYAEVLVADVAAQFELEEVQAAFVAMDPQTGGVLALHSTPGFDPNLFVGGIEPGLWSRLSQDPGKPLLDRAAGAAQPPGSTFKLLVAAMALDLGVLSPGEYMPVPCTGGMRFQNRFARCWSVHGSQNLIGAIKHSCDVYFYQVGIRIGLERYLKEGTRLGFARKTGIDLPSEAPSIFPASLSWWEETFGYKPYENEIMSLSIGQGAVTLTPLKLTQMFAALARPDGRAPAPRLARTGRPVRYTFRAPVTREQLEILRRGMRRVVAPGGTAALSRLPHWDFMGKTGTAENPLGKDHAWFVGIGGPPGELPEIVATMLVYAGEHGKDVSGAVANAINFYLNRKHGRPFDRFPTPRDRFPRKMYIDWKWYLSDVQDYTFPEDEDRASGRARAGAAPGPTAAASRP